MCEVEAGMKRIKIVKEGGELFCGACPYKENVIDVAC